MEYYGGILLSILGLVLAWFFISKIIRAKTNTGRNIKVTIVVLLFASLIIKFSHDLYALTQRTIFSFHKLGDVALEESPFKIPANQDKRYCQQFTDQKGRPIETVSVREDGKYCGEYWRFKSKKTLLLPYITGPSNETIYWASPTLQIVVKSPNDVDKNKKPSP